MIDFILIAAISQSILLGFYFGINHKKYFGYIYLSILLFIVAISIFSGFLYSTKKILEFPYLARSGFVFVSLIGGLVQLSTRSMIEKTNRPKVNDLFFFIIPNIIFFYLLTFFLSDTDTKLSYLKEDLVNLHTDCYIISIFSALNNFFGILFSILFFLRKSNKKYIIHYSIILVIIAITLFISIFNKNLINSGLYSFLISCFIILWSYQIIYRKSSDKKQDFLFETEIKYEKSKIKDDFSNELGLKIKAYLDNEKPFFDPDFQLKDLTERFEINPQISAQIFSNFFKKTFSELINEYRVNEVILRLKENNSKKLNILNIAFECGFNTKSSFNAKFKKITGKTPTEYKKNVQPN